MGNKEQIISLLRTHIDKEIAAITGASLQEIVAIRNREKIPECFAHFFKPLESNGTKKRAVI